MVTDDSHRRWKRLFYVVLAVTIVLLLMPGPVVLAVKVWIATWLPYAQVIEEADVVQMADKLVHLSLFAALGALATLTWRSRNKLRRVVVVLVLLGIGTESLQIFIPGRGADPLDLLVDWIGLGFGLLVMARILLQKLPRVNPDS